jgi:hypothetical protein
MQTPSCTPQHEVQTVHVVESFEGSENGTNRDVLAQEIVEDLDAALEQFREIAVDLYANSVSEQDPQLTE